MTISNQGNEILSALYSKYREINLQRYPSTSESDIERRWIAAAERTVSFYEWLATNPFKDDEPLD